MHKLVLLALVVFVFLQTLTAAAPVRGDDGNRLDLPTLDGPVISERVLRGVVEPVAIEFLPDGDALIAQRKAGKITRVNFQTGDRADLTGLPSLQVKEEAGVHDLELHPQYESNGWVYVTYSEGEPSYSTLVLDRFRLEGHVATDRERLFTADAYTEGLYHFAARIAFVDGYVYVAIGDREHPPTAQDLEDHAGTVIRLHDDGRVPDDNPYSDSGADDENAPRKEIWSYGHRDPQGLYTHPETGELWSHEHGPRGGDELNRIQKGANYGWPVISYGFEYEGGPIGMGLPVQEGMIDALWVYVPSIAPSDLLIYDGAAFPQWKGNFFLGAMAGVHLNRLVMRGGEIVAEERIGRYVMGRIRALAVDDDGLIYLGSDNGEIWRLRPGS